MCWEHGILDTGPPAKSQGFFLYFVTTNSFFIIIIVTCLFFFFFKNLFIFNGRIITAQYCFGFYQTSTWISHGLQIHSWMHTWPPSIPSLWDIFSVAPGVSCSDHIFLSFQFKLTLSFAGGSQGFLGERRLEKERVWVQRTQNEWGHACVWAGKAPHPRWFLPVSAQPCACPFPIALEGFGGHFPASSEP